MTTRTYGLLGILLMLVLVFFATSANAQEGTPTIIELRANNQVTTGVGPGSLVLPKPQLDVLRSEDPDLGPSWEEVRMLRLRDLVNKAMERIHFEFDSSEVDAEGREHAQVVANLLLMNQDVGMVMGCHTDLMGSNEYNQALSERRANSVSVVLQEMGVPVERLKTIALGETMPEVATQTKERQNRRCQAADFFLTIKPVQF